MTKKSDNSFEFDPSKAVYAQAAAGSSVGPLTKVYEPEASKPRLEWKCRCYGPDLYPVILKAAYDELKAKHEELLSYLPKVPTEPYERRMAKELVELKAEAEKLAEALYMISGAIESNYMEETPCGVQTLERAIDAMANWQRYLEQDKGEG